MIVPKLNPDGGIRIVAFEPRHLLLVEAKDKAYDLPGFNRMQQGIWYANHSGTRGFTGFDGDHVMGCAGLTRTREGVALAWAHLGDMRGHNKWFVRTTKQFLESVAAELGVIRVEAVAPVAFRQSWHWLKLLGFEVETPNGMKNYGKNGEDYYLLARYF